MTQAKKANYHHGNLRLALLDTALDALTRESLENLSLRGLAKSVGVTPSAVYGHFVDKTALLIELRTLGFIQLSESMSQALAALPSSSRAEDKLRALGRAYMDFSRTKPHLFDTLFSWSPELERITAECTEAGASSENMLRDILIELIREQSVEPTAYQASVASFSAWSLVHGISTLLKTGSVEGAVHCGNWPDAFSSGNASSQARIIDHLLTIEIEGLKASVKEFRERD